jgi:hypothetical protein
LVRASVKWWPVENFHIDDLIVDDVEDHHADPRRVEKDVAVAWTVRVVRWLRCVKLWQKSSPHPHGRTTSRESTKVASPGSSLAINASRSSPDNLGHRLMSRSTDQ